MDLTCVDYSAEMLAVFKEKLARAALRATVLERDVRDLDLHGFDYAFIGFHSFSELVTREDRAAALRSIGRALRPGGALTLSLYNPAQRVPLLDGHWHTMGPFPLPRGGQLDTRCRYHFDPETATASGVQRYRELSAEGALLRQAEMPVRFSMPGAQELEQLAAEPGFEPVRWWGDYQGADFDAEQSTFILCELRLRSG